MFHNFSNFDCHLFFITLIDKKPENIPLHVIPRTNEKYISISYGGNRFIDSYRFLQNSLDDLVKTVDELTILKKDFSNNCEFLSKKLAYPYEYFKSYDGYNLPITNLTKEDYFKRLKNGQPQDGEIQRTNEIFHTFKIKTGKELTELYLKTDVNLVADVFEKFIKVSLNEFIVNPLHHLSLSGYTWECGLKYTEWVYNLYGWAMSQNLPYDEIKLVDNVNLEDILNTSDDRKVGFSLNLKL